MNNIILATDSYKAGGHWQQYPQNTQYIYSYFESRGGEWDSTVFFGLQYFLKKYLEGQVVCQSKIDEAAEIFALHFGNDRLFNKKGWEYILHKHNGYLPISIKAVPEGSIVPTHNVLMTIVNTDPECYWLTNYLETLLVQVWYPTTVCTQSYQMKKILRKYLEKTGDVSLIDFKLHDFGFRGVSSVESAGIGGAAHLVNFKGTDTVAGVILARDYYEEPIAGFSIPAAEHSTITSWGKENELAAMSNMLDRYPTGLVAIVSDSFDIYNACENILGKELKDRILSRNGTVVCRPDSGDPLEVLPKVLHILGEKFGYSVNDNGYKVLDPHIRVIQGDGIDIKSMETILEVIENYGWSTDNIAFGSGGGLLQKLNRDTLKFAFKCSSATINGKENDVWKDPVTDSGKMSKRGKLKLIKCLDNKYITTNDSYIMKDHLVEVFRDGKLLKDYKFSEIRENANV